MRARMWPAVTTGLCTSRMSQLPPAAPGTMIAACMLFFPSLILAHAPQRDRRRELHRHSLTAGGHVHLKHFRDQIGWRKLPSRLDQIVRYRVLRSGRSTPLVLLACFAGRVHDDAL